MMIVVMMKLPLRTQTTLLKHTRNPLRDNQAAFRLRSFLELELEWVLLKKMRALCLVSGTFFEISEWFWFRGHQMVVKKTQRLQGEIAVVWWILGLLHRESRASLELESQSKVETELHLRKPKETFRCVASPCSEFKSKYQDISSARCVNPDNNNNNNNNNNNPPKPTWTCRCQHPPQCTWSKHLVAETQPVVSWVRAYSFFDFMF